MSSASASPRRIQEVDLQRDVEHRRRLVADDEVRVQHERLRHPDALALPTRQLVRVLVEELLGGRQPDLLQHLDDRLLVLVGPIVVDGQRLADEFAHRLPGVQRVEGVLEDDLDVTPELREVAVLVVFVGFTVEHHLAPGRVLQERHRHER